MNYLFSIFLTVLMTSMAFAAPYERIKCEGVELKIVKDRLLFPSEDSDTPASFFMSERLREVLLTLDEQFSVKKNALTKGDLVDKKSKNFEIEIRGSWTGMRVSYDLTVFKKKKQIAHFESCSYSPWQAGVTN